MQQAPEIDKDILERLYAVIQDELGIDPRRLDTSKNFIFELGLDSVQLMAVSMRIDAEFGINLPMTIIESATLADFLQVFKKQIEEISGT
jgi:acyl carrier protein